MPRHQPPPLDRLTRLGVSVLGALPRPVQRRLAGRPVEIDGQRLHPEVQLALRALSLVSGPTFETLPLTEGRGQLAAEAWVFQGRPTRVGRVGDLHLDVEEDRIPARFYEPHRAGSTAPLGLLVYFHGGGWVLGDLDTHDALCRLLCDQAGVAVLNVGYRLAPEHPFPAAVDDALTAFRWAHANAARLGVDPTRIAVGGDSAGGNLATVVAQHTVSSQRCTGGHDPAPAYQLLFAPVTDLAARSRSYTLFGSGFFLTAAQMDWYAAHYLTNPDQALDPRVSPLRAEDLTGLPPAYVAVGGFDLLRDEVVAYATRLREAGVRVELRVHPGLVHPFVNAIGVGTTSRAAVIEAAAALRAGLA